MPQIPQAESRRSTVTGAVQVTEPLGPGELPNNSRALSRLAATGNRAVAALNFAARQKQAIESSRATSKAETAFLREESELQHSSNLTPSPDRFQVNQAGRVERIDNLVAGVDPSDQDALRDRLDRLSIRYEETDRKQGTLAGVAQMENDIKDLLLDSQQAIAAEPSYGNASALRDVMHRHIDTLVENQRITDDDIERAARNQVDSQILEAWARRNNAAGNFAEVAERIWSDDFERVPFTKRDGLYAAAQAGMKTKSKHDTYQLARRHKAAQDVAAETGEVKGWGYLEALDAYGPERADAMQDSVEQAARLHRTTQELRGANPTKMQAISRGNLPQGAPKVVAEVTAYYPKDDAEAHGLDPRVEGGTKDRHGNTIPGQTTMEDYLAGRGPGYVTVAMDRNSEWQGRYLASPQFPGVVFRVMDTGGHGDGKGEGWIDIAWSDPKKAKAWRKKGVTFQPISEQQVSNRKSRKEPIPMADVVDESDQIEFSQAVDRMIADANEQKQADPFTYYTADPVSQAMIEDIRTMQDIPVVGDVFGKPEDALRDIALEAMRSDPTLHPDQYGIMAKQSAEGLVDRWQNAVAITGDDTEGTAGIDQFLAEWTAAIAPRHQPIALRQIGQVKGGEEVIGALDPLLWHQNSPAMLRQLVGAMRSDKAEDSKRFSSETTGMTYPEFTQKISENKELIAYRAGLMKGDPFDERNLAVMNGVSNLFEAYARRLVLDGGGKVSIDEAAAAFFSNHAVEVGESTVMVPDVIQRRNGEMLQITPEKAERIGSWLSLKKDDLESQVANGALELADTMFPRGLADPAFDAGVTTPAEEGANIIDKGGFWITNEDSNGAFLAVPASAPGASLAVRTRGGGRVEFFYEDIVDDLNRGINLRMIDQHVQRVLTEIPDATFLE